MPAPRITVIGAASHFFAHSMIAKLARSGPLRGATLALVDTDAGALDAVARLARKVFAATGADVAVTASTDRREMLPGSRYVVLTFSRGNTRYRSFDCAASLGHGIRMCSGDTIGPGGVFRALREVPAALAMARDAEELCPDATLINLVNPTAVLGIALMHHARLRGFALCDGLHEPHVRLGALKRVGILPEDATAVPPEVEAGLELRIGGVNHFTWMTRFTYRGVDQLPRWRELLAADAAAEERGVRDWGARPDLHPEAKETGNPTYALQLMDVFGAFPMLIGHAKEYVPYFQGHGRAAVRPEPIRIFDSAARQREMDARRAETVQYGDDREPLERFLAVRRLDHAMDVIEELCSGAGGAFYVNGPNRGAVTNLAADAFVELRSRFVDGVPRPEPFGAMPAGLLGLTQRILDVHELTVQAAVEQDRDLLLRALAADPLAVNLADIRAIRDELLERERDVLPPGWYR